MSRSNRTNLAFACTLGLIALPAPARAIDPNHLPDDAQVVLTINFRQMLKSELAQSNKDIVAQIKTLIDNQLSDFGAQRYIEQLGFDVQRDVERVTVVTTGGKIPSFAVLEGKFDAEKFATTADEAIKDNPDHIKAIKIAGKRVYEFRINPEDAPYFAGLASKDKLLFTSTQDAFAEAVGRIGAGSTKQSKLKKELRDLLGPGSAKQSVSLVTTGPALVKLLDDAPVPNIEDLQGLLGGVSALNVTLTIEKNINFEVAVNARDKKTADEMAKLAGVGIAAGKLLLKDRAEKDAKYVPGLDIINALRVTSEGTRFALRGEITAATLAKLLKDLPK